MQSKIELSNEHIDEFCRRWRVEELAIEHNRKEHSPAAEPGLRVKFEPSAEWSFTERERMQQEFQLLSGRDIHFHRRSLSTRRGHPSMRVLYNA